eukprot:6475040-Amphidinium_carterae.1
MVRFFLVRGGGGPTRARIPCCVSSARKGKRKKVKHTAFYCEAEFLTYRSVDTWDIPSTRM